MQACATGVHLKDATITHRKSGKGQHEYLNIKMNDVIITGVQHGGSEGSSETVNLTFAKVDLEYRPQKADGSLEPGIHLSRRARSEKDRGCADRKSKLESTHRSPPVSSAPNSHSTDRDCAPSRPRR